MNSHSLMSAHAVAANASSQSAISAMSLVYESLCLASMALLRSMQSRSGARQGDSSDCFMALTTMCRSKGRALTKPSVASNDLIWSNDWSIRSITSPASSYIFSTTSGRLARAAECRGVWPCLSLICSSVGLFLSIMSHISNLPRIDAMWRGISPSLFCILSSSGLSSTSLLTNSTVPLFAKMCMIVSPLSLVTSQASGPTVDTMLSITLGWPLLTAKWIGVSPSLSLVLSRSGAALYRVSKASTLPNCAAVWRAVKPSRSCTARSRALHMSSIC
mmetsp:Transcript_47425/g.118450  ORF Transcript_47425/g.118450 Transcript_47425/m.118450 type:complete len:275 (-) Transcript_47425:1065-1889(-)